MTANEIRSFAETALKSQGRATFGYTTADPAYLALLGEMCAQIAELNTQLANLIGAVVSGGCVDVNVHGR